MPAEASTAAVPERWRTQWHIRRYGFHGLSVQWASEQVRVKRLVVCHLGGGCSVSAVLDGRSVDTTMGFSPLEGVAMATRSGSLDPAAILYLLAARGRRRRRDRAGARARVGAARAVGALRGRGGPRALGRAGRAAGARRLLLSHRQCDRGDVGGARAGSTRSSSAAAWGRAPRSSGHGCARASASSVSSSSDELNAAATRRCRDCRGRLCACGSSSSVRART